MRALYYLVKMVTSFFAVMFLLRFFMQLFRVSFFNLIGSLVSSLTDPLVKPLRRVLPGLAGLDWASLLPAYLLIWLPLILFHPIQLGYTFWFALIELLITVIYLFEFAIILYAVLSWVAPYSVFGPPLRQITAPLLSPVRRILPPISGIDLSPLVVLVLLQALILLLCEWTGWPLSLSIF